MCVCVLPRLALNVNVCTFSALIFQMWMNAPLMVTTVTQMDSVLTLMAASSVSVTLAILERGQLTVASVCMQLCIV